MFVSSLPARVDPADWLDEELPILGRGLPGGVPGLPDHDGVAVSYSPVAELDAVDVAERAGTTAPPGADDDWDAELSGGIPNFAEFRLCQNKLNR